MCGSFLESCDYLRARRVDNLWSIRGCSVSSLSVFYAIFSLGSQLMGVKLMQGYVLGGADHEKIGPETIRNLPDPESGSCQFFAAKCLGLFSRLLIMISVSLMRFDIRT